MSIYGDYNMCMWHTSTERKSFEKLEKLLRIINVRNAIESTHKKADGRLLILDLLLLSLYTCTRKAGYQPELHQFQHSLVCYTWNPRPSGGTTNVWGITDPWWNSTDDLLNLLSYFSLFSFSFRPIGLVMLPFPENSKSNLLPQILPRFGIWGPWTDYH